MTIRNSDLANFGTKAERQTELEITLTGDPKQSGNITEHLINQHAKKARQKLEGNKKMEH